MLYQTHHLLNSSNSDPFPPFLSAAAPSLFSSSLQEMEYVEAALKTSFRKEMALKSSPQAFFDDFWAVNVQSGVSSDDFSVDELFDFSNEDGFLEQPPEEEEEEDEEETERNNASTISSFSISPRKQNQQLFTQIPGFNFGFLTSGELTVPADEEADLEWLSHFVEDSNAEYSAPFPTEAKLEIPSPHPLESEKRPPTPCFMSPVPAKARSKRARTGGRIWSLVGTPSLTESSSSSTSSSSSCSPTSPWLIYATPSSSSVSKVEPVEQVSSEKAPVKKQKKKPLTESADDGTAQAPRRCSHCGVTKTPQWRAGPLGSKSLCNACGVRFKSGRLLPEYRPACSPMFSAELHSNHHRKVLEMRRKKEGMGQAGETGAVVPVVPSY